MIVTMRRPHQTTKPEPPATPSAEGAIAQKDLEEILFMRGRINQLTAAYNAKCSKVLGLIQSGARIEPGRRTADLEVDQSGPSYTMRLTVF